MSRGKRTPPSAHTCPPSAAASAAHSTTAENCGRPTPVIILVVHIAPGPTPTLTTSAPAPSSWPGADSRHHVAGDDRCFTRHMAGGFDRAQRALLMAVGGVDHEHVDTHREQRLGLALDVSVDADGNRDHQPPVGVDRGPVDRGPQRALAGDDPDEAALFVEHRRELTTLGGQRFERRRRVDTVLEGRELAADHGVELCESVVAGGIAVGEHAERRAALVHHHDGVVRPLVDQSESVPDGVLGRQRDRRLVHRVPALHVVDHRPHHVERDVLGQHGEPAAARHRLGHAPPSDRGHVRDDDGQRRAEAVGRGEVDVEARFDRRQVRHHEHVGVGEVVVGRVQHPHGARKARTAIVMMRATERQRGSGHNRPAWPGNAVMAWTAIVMMRATERQRGSGPRSLGPWRRC